MVALNELIDQMVQVVGTRTCEETERIKSDLLESCFMDTFYFVPQHKGEEENEVWLLSGVPDVNLVMITGEVALGSGFEHLEKFMLDYDIQDCEKVGALKTIADTARQYMLHNCSRLEFSLAAMDFNQDISNIFGTSHEPDNSFYNFTKVTGIIKGGVVGGLIGGGIPATITSVYTGVIPNITAWFSGAVFSILFVAVSSFRAATDKRERSIRERPGLGEELRVREDVTLPEEYGNIKPNGEEGKCIGKRETYLLTGKNINQLVVGGTHLFAYREGRISLGLDEWQKQNRTKPLFKSTVIDGSPGPTVGLARLVAEIDDNKIGVEVAEAYHYNSCMELVGDKKNTYRVLVEFSLSNRMVNLV